MGTRPIMVRPFDFLTREFTRLSDEFQNCQDPQKRKELLVAMQMIVVEAEHVIQQHDAGKQGKS